MKRNNKPLYIGLLVVLLGVIGGTMAYFGTNNTFENVFNADDYIIETSEVFESPDNWQPGDVTPKKITVTNKGDVEAAVRVWFEESWIDKNGNPLSVDNIPVSINFALNYMDYWFNDCDQGNYYYYYKILSPNESTKPLLESINFIQNNTSVECTTDETTHTQICSSTYGDYTGGKYTLTAHIETVQAREVENVWGSPTVNGRDGCEPLTLRSANYLSNTLIYEYGDSYKTFGLQLSKYNFESLITVNNMNVPNNAIQSWDASENKDGTIKAWYTDNDNNGFYELYIGANGKVRANPNSSYEFAHFSNLKYIDLRNLDTSQVEDMSGMFSRLGRQASTLTILGIEDLDTSNVINMSEMFWEAGGSGLTIDFSNWDVSNVRHACSMFEAALFTHTGTDSLEGFGECPN